LFADLRTLAPALSPSSSSCRNPADLDVLNGFVTGVTARLGGTVTLRNQKDGDSGLCAEVVLGRSSLRHGSV